MVTALGTCIVCDKETRKVIFKNAIVKTYVCSRECLKKYFAPVGRVTIVTKLCAPSEDESWLN